MSPFSVFGSGCWPVLGFDWSSASGGEAEDGGKTHWNTQLKNN